LIKRKETEIRTNPKFEKGYVQGRSLYYKL